jgi:serine/threonine protein kinase
VYYTVTIVFNIFFSSDIKGGNIMLMPTGVIKLIDFGCAKRLYMVSLVILIRFIFILKHLIRCGFPQGSVLA